MSDRTYILRNDATGEFTDIILWNGDTKTWAPPAGFSAILYDDSLREKLQQDRTAIAETEKAASLEESRATAVEAVSKGDAPELRIVRALSLAVLDQLNLLRAEGGKLQPLGQDEFAKLIAEKITGGDADATATTSALMEGIR